MPAHHRFHPIEIQTIALFISFVPVAAAIALAFFSRRLGGAKRPRTVVRRSSAPVFTSRLVQGD